MAKKKNKNKKKKSKKKNVAGTKSTNPNSDSSSSSSSSSSSTIEPIPKPSSPRKPNPLERNIFIKFSQMSDEMIDNAVQLTITAFRNQKFDINIAEYITRGLNVIYGPTWQCVVGANFGSYVSFEPGHILNFFLENKVVLIFKINKY